MSWKPIVVGVDGSPESVRAASAGAMIAQRAGVDCQLVRAVPDYEAMLRWYGMVGRAAASGRHAIERDRQTTRSLLRDYVPDALLDDIEIRVGKPPVVLLESARRNGAGLVIVGSKPHLGLDRIRGGTVRHLLRTCDVPLLVSDGGTPAITRVLAALDLSPASGATLEAAQRWARLFGAQLRVIHVMEPAPMIPGEVPSVAGQSARAGERARTTGLWSRIEGAATEKVVRTGYAASTIANEVAQWGADLLVIGSHGAGWVDRLLIGSTAEHLTERPPTLTLVVPVGLRAADRPLEVGALPWEERAAQATAEAGRN